MSEVSPAPGAATAQLPEYAPGQVLVGVRSAAVQSATLLAGMQAELISVFDAGDPQDGVETWIMRVPVGAELTVIDHLRGDQAVVYAEPNWRVYAADDILPLQPDAITAPDSAPALETPFPVNDPLYAAQQWHMQRINASRGWQLAFDANLFPNGQREIRVSVIDSGVDATHPEFAGRTLTGTNYVETVNGEPSHIMIDDCGHGSHVSGLVAAGLNDAKGVAGPAPKAKIEARRVLAWNTDLSACTGFVSEVARAIRDATDSGIDIINLSLTVPSLQPFDLQTLHSAVQYADGRGVLMVAAAGNSGINSVYYPARFPEVMAVAALGFGDLREAYSNSGNEVEIAAPGGNQINTNHYGILSTWSEAAADRCRYSSYIFIRGATYCRDIGTSMSAGIVSGVAALVWSLDTTLSADEVRSILRSTATPLIGQTASEVGSGKINMADAVRRLVRSDLAVTPSQLVVDVISGTQPITLDVRLDNQSLEPIDWRATVSSASWITVPVATATGSAAYGHPAIVHVVVKPAGLLSGSYQAQLSVKGVRTDGSQVVKSVSINVRVGIQARYVYIPLLTAIGSGIKPAAVEYSWEMPAAANDRVSYALTDDSTIAVSLPPTLAFAFQGVTRTSLRISSEGFVSFGAISPATAKPSDCLSSVVAPQPAIYGWWGRLNPAAPKARVSTFPLGNDRFVIEYADVPTEGVTPAYTVSFQIVLHHDGSIRLNYQRTPSLLIPTSDTVVGVNGQDGLFYNQLACAAGGRVTGWFPQSMQSYIIRPEDLF